MNWLRICATAGWLGLAMSGRAQPYSVNWFTLEAGATSSGGVYSVSSAMGQPDAGVMSGGSFTLEGGFWPASAVRIAPVPTLRVQRIGDQLSISWSPATPGFSLEMTGELGAPAWLPAPSGNANPTTLTPSANSTFYRLAKKP